MEFEDRVSKYPNRYKMTDENDNVSMVYLERADEPVVPGTPLNAETFNSLYLYSESTKYPGCFYRVVDGEEEWVNPPMLPSAAYRTTKRYKGYPVYTTAFPISKLEGDTYSTGFMLTGIARIVGVSTTYYKKGTDGSEEMRLDPMVDADGVCLYTRVVNKNNVKIEHVRSGFDYANWSAVVVVDTTREGD